MKWNTGRSLQTIERGLEIIEAIKQHEGLTLAEVATEFDMAESTMHGYLTTFRNHGYLVKEGEVYHLGLRFLNPASYAKTRKREYTLAKEAAETLGNVTNEVIDFDVEENYRIINLINVFGPMNERSVRQHRYFYMHTTGTGKAILAAMPDEEVRTVVEQVGLPKVTPYTIESEAELFEEIEAARERGYAYNDQQHIEGLQSIGAAVRYPSGEIFGALSIAGPVYRLEGRIETEIAPNLLVAVRALEEQLELEPDERRPFGQEFETHV